MNKNFKFTYIYLLKNALGLAVFASLSIYSVSCKKDNPGLKPSEERYYPLQTGFWREYDVDSVVFRGSTFEANDTVHFQLREETDSTFTDNTGTTNYFVKTLYRANNTENWTLRYISAASIKGRYAELLQNNNRYIKLVFPAYENAEWDANLYNNSDPDKFIKSKYTSVHNSANINGKNFDSTVVVEVKNEENAILREYETEQYAAGIGLIKHVWESIETQKNPDTNVEGNVRRGWFFYKNLTGYGKQ